MAGMEFGQLVELLQEIGRYKNKDKEVPELSPLYALEHVGLEIPNNSPLLEIIDHFREYYWGGKQKDPMKVALLIEKTRACWMDIRHVKYLDQSFYDEWSAKEEKKRLKDKSHYHGHGNGD